MPETHDPARWTQRPERGSGLALDLMLWLARVLGRRPTRWLLPPIAAWFWLRTPDSRADSRRYLERALGRPARAIDTYRHYLSFSSTILDRLFLMTGRFELFEFEVHGSHHLDRLLVGGHGAFLAGAHFGSLEALRACGRDATGRRIAMAMYEHNAQRIGALLRRVDPTLADDIVALGRADSMIVLAERLAHGDLIGLLADRSFGGEPAATVPFLGEPAPFPTGVFRMAAVLRCPVIAMAGIYLGANRYALHFVPIADFSDVERGPARLRAVDEAVGAYAAQLERFCRQAPYNWFNFYDFWDHAPVGPQSGKADG